MMQCTPCKLARDAKRLPPGWHRDTAANVYCPACWHARYLLRAVTVPVTGPVDGDWPELREALKTCFRATTRLSNWAVTELAKADIVRRPDMDKLPKPPQVYLYPDARALVPEIDSGSVVAILHAVEGRWRKRRYNVVWLGSESLPNYRYDRAVYPVRSQDWKATKGANDEALVSVRLAGRRWTLRLRGGKEFFRQLKSHTQLVNGTAIGCELAIYEQKANGNDHRNGTEGRDSGGNRQYRRLMCKMVAWLPREPQKSLDGTLFVRTDPDALLIALNAKEERLWIENCDQLKRWTAEHSRRLQRWADDSKAEARPVPALSSRRQAAAIKYRNRMDSLCHEVASHLVGYASRRRFAAIQYNDSVQTYCTRFPWEKLRSLIAEKADAAGIAFERCGDEKTTATPRNSVSEED